MLRLELIVEHELVQQHTAMAEGLQRDLKRPHLGEVKPLDVPALLVLELSDGGL